MDILYNSDDFHLTAESLVSVVETVAKSITDDCSGADDASGGHVRCLTESVMGMTAGLMKIADAIDNHAEAIRESKF
jgi:hypothetical protein